jgi:quercetin dioxygenase-like cupin family protein
LAERVFLRGIEGAKYNLKAHREARVAAPHSVPEGERSWRDENAVGHEDASPTSKAKWMVGPGDEPFLTQTIQCHFVHLDPAGANGGHGHQNEAAFYIISGSGYEIHDTQRYEWKAGDLVVVHNDSKHQHFNASVSEPAVAIVVKAKALFMYLGLTQQGRGSTIADGRDDEFGPREDWSRLWSPGVAALRKIVPGDKEPWRSTPDGRIKWLANKDMDVRLFTVDVWLQDLAGSAASTRHWHMADEIFHVLEGSGRTLEWQVEADIDDRYYARVAKEPKRTDWTAGDVVYVPQNTVHQHFSGPAGALLIGAQNRLFKLIGYDSVVTLEPAPDTREEATASR